MNIGIVVYNYIKNDAPEERVFSIDVVILKLKVTHGAFL